MLECVIHIPHTDNAGNDTKQDRILLEQKLLHTFGGLTVHNCAGAWLSPEGKVFSENIFRYIVAIEPVMKNLMVFENIALQMCILMNQEAIYYKIGDTVTFAFNPTSPKKPTMQSTNLLH